MVDVSRTFTVPRPPEEVVAYLSDFSNAVAWDPGTVRCDRVGTGPVQVGSTWRNVSKVLGRETELEYVLVTLEPDHVVLRGTNKTATSTDDITVLPDPAGSGRTVMSSVEVAVLLVPRSTTWSGSRVTSTYSSSVSRPRTLDTLRHVEPTCTGPVPTRSQRTVPGSQATALEKSLR